MNKKSLFKPNPTNLTYVFENLESRVKTYSCELYVCVCEKKVEFREVSHTHGIFQLLLLKLLLRFLSEGNS